MKHKHLSQQFNTTTVVTSKNSNVLLTMVFFSLGLLVMLRLFGHV